MLRCLKELSQFLRDGVVVDTPESGDAALRTVVQLDGDVLTFATRDAVSETLQCEHWSRVAARIEPIADRLRGTARLPTWPVGLTYILAAVWRHEEILAGSWETVNLERIVLHLTIGFGVSAMGWVPLLRRAMWKAVLWGVRRWPFWR